MNGRLSLSGTAAAGHLRAPVLPVHSMHVFLRRVPSQPSLAEPLLPPTPILSVPPPSLKPSSSPPAPLCYLYLLRQLATTRRWTRPTGRTPTRQSGRGSSRVKPGATAKLPQLRRPRPTPHPTPPRQLQQVTILCTLCHGAEPTDPSP